MVNYKFKISDMIPNSWLCKLKDMSTTSIKSKNKPKKKQPITSSSSSSLSSSSTSSVFSSGAPPPQTNKPHLDNQPETHQRKSYYFTRDLAVSDRNVHQNSPPPPATEARLPNSPRKSAKKRRPTNNKRSVHRKSLPERLITTSTISTGCNCRAASDPYSETTSSENESLLPDLSGSGHGSFTSMVSSLSCPCRKSSSSDDKFENADLPPIITKPEKLEDRSGSGKWVINERNQYPPLSVKVAKEDILGISAKEQRTRKLPGKLKTNNYSPRVGSRVKVQAINGGRRSTGDRRRSILDSFAVVKTSVDPQKDFKESMVEMIMENKIRGSKELEELLACYLSLNSNEYHDLIIKVFKQIWFENARC